VAVIDVIGQVPLAYPAPVQLPDPDIVPILLRVIAWYSDQGGVEEKFSVSKVPDSFPDVGDKGLVLLTEPIRP
jgi:hypothetical protein